MSDGPHDKPTPPRPAPRPRRTVPSRAPTKAAGAGAATALAGRCLIAMPAMADPRFVTSVIYLCAHSDGGAMGLIVNRPAPDVRFADLLDQLDIDHGPDLPDIRVHLGGPVEPGRGFVLHSDDYRNGSATPVGDSGIAMSATLDILGDIAGGAGPASSMLALGYAGWGPGQLDAEIAGNSWLVCPASPELIFGRAHEFKWSAALKSIRVDPVMLSSTGGRA